MDVFTALKISLLTFFPEAIIYVSHSAEFKIWLNIDVDDSKLSRYKKKSFLKVMLERTYLLTL